MNLPRNLDILTIVRHDGDPDSGSYVGTLNQPPAPQRVLVRRIGPEHSGSRARLDARVSDLRSLRHPSLSKVFGMVEDEGACWVVESWTAGIPLSAIVRRCAARGATVPNEVFLHLAIQLCSLMEAMHARSGSGSDPTLHLALSPGAISVGLDGRPTLGRYGLLPTGPSDAAGPGSGYLAPEQTATGGKLGPSTDVFSLGALLFELVTLEPLFGSPAAPVRADVTTRLLGVGEGMPGLDKILMRALSAKPAHRYQSAFVLREDLRGLTAACPCADPDRAARDFFAPMVRTAVGWKNAPAVEEPGLDTRKMSALLAAGPAWTPPLRPVTGLDFEEMATQLLRTPRVGMSPTASPAVLAPPPAILGLPGDLGTVLAADPESSPTVLMLRSVVDPAVLAASLAADVPPPAEIVPAVVPERVPDVGDDGVTEFVRDVVLERVPAVVPERVPDVAPERVPDVVPEEPPLLDEEEPPVPVIPLWTVALMAAVFVLTCGGVSSAGILSFLATRPEHADRPPIPSEAPPVRSEEPGR